MDAAHQTQRLPLERLFTVLVLFCFFEVFLYVESVSLATRVTLVSHQGEMTNPRKMLTDDR